MSPLCGLYMGVEAGVAGLLTCAVATPATLFAADAVGCLLCNRVLI
jgi:hypothetical protein